MTDVPYILHYAPDNASLVIRLALEELGQPYRTHLVDRHQAAQKAPAHLALHPGGQIPALETPHGPIFETAAILLWLADRHGSLMPPPNDPARGDALKWLFYLSNTLHPSLRMLFYPDTFVDAASLDAFGAKTRTRILDHLAILEARWQAGPVPLALELYLGPMLRWIQLYPHESDRSWIDLSAHPALLKMATGLDARPSTQAAQSAEGLGPTPFTSPQRPTPPEGSAL